jgi:GNAT superfamily N-acetyltransferase
LVDGLTIRDAVVADLPELQDIFRRSSLSNLSDRADLLANPEVLEFADRSGQERCTRVAVAGERIVGFASTVDTGNGVELDDLFVDPIRMGQGIGRRLVLDLMAHARACGVTRVDVAANSHAVGFYERVGFVPDGEVHTRFGRAMRMHRDV